jgi:hypothetical protein
MVLDVRIPDLTFPKMKYGTHESPPDLRTLLYRGGSSALVTKATEMLDGGLLGQPIIDRLPLVMRLHEVITADLTSGTSQVTIKGRIRALRSFYSWADSRGLDITLASATSSYRAWAEALLHRVRVEKSLSERTAYHDASRVGSCLSRALSSFNKKGDFIRSTRMRSPKMRKRVLSSKADKQNLEQTFLFGRALVDLCDGLSAENVFGSLPVVITIEGHQTLSLTCRRRPDETLKSLRHDASAWRRRRTLERRGNLDVDHLRRARSSILNLRMEAELLLFITQTGMNLAQAVKLRRSNFRFQTDGDEIVAYVYKARRRGEAIFRAFRAYKEHFFRYLKWLDAIFSDPGDDRLFPFVHTAKIPSVDHLPGFSSIQKQMKALGIVTFSPQVLRKTRVNWLLRRSHDPMLTAEMAQHTKEVLLRVYDQPHHQSAAMEITRFHHAIDPAIASPGPGMCVDVHNDPTPIPDCPQAAPKPDCISPEGCLFCIYHRDIASQDYCWKLTSHRRVKTIELSHYAPPEKNPPEHPAQVVIDRINAKLNAIEASNEVRAVWVRDASDATRAGRYHPAWDGFIQLLEST